jgi:DNA-binding beta-propeller fold protein YncE
MRLAPALLVLAGCFGSGGIDPPGDRFFFPTGIALTPDGRYLLVANSNFDLKYNSGTVNVVDLAVAEATIAECGGRCADDLGDLAPRDEKEFLVADSTVVIGSQVTDLVLSPDGTRAYATVRGNASLTWFDVNAAAGAPRVLSCFDDRTTPGVRGCDSAHEVIRTGDTWLPAEPYTLLADEDWVFTGHADSGNVGVFSVAEGREPELVRVLDFFPYGVNGFARQMDGASGLIWYYLVSRNSARVYPFNITMLSRHAGEGPAVSTGPAIQIGSNSPGTDCRSIAFSPDGTRAFVTNREPPSVVVIDTTLRSDGTPAGTNLATLELGRGPSKLVVQPLPDGSYLVLVVCFDAEEIFVVDPVTMTKVDVFKTGAGPHALVPAPAARRAYLANFGESTVWVLDFDPASPNFRRPILSIGTPEIPTGHG